LPQTEEFSCKGFNYSVTLRSDKMTIRNTGWSKPDSHELPIRQINAVIVRRKSIVPFAAFTALAAIATVLTRYNVLWFLISLSAEEEAILSTTTFLAAVLCAIPAVSRALFVDILISWGGRPKSFLVRFVSAQQGRRLARRFQGASTGT